MSPRDSMQAAYVLHSRPYLETSGIVDLFTLEQGKVSVVAKGLRRPTSKLRGVMQPFVPLHVHWRGKQPLKSLLVAEATGLNGIIQGSALMCGLYINELLQRLLVPHEPVPRLYVYYQYVLNALVAGDDVEGALRTFEHKLLSEIGYALPIDTVLANQLYYFDPPSWSFEAVTSIDEDLRHSAFSGQQLLDIADDCYETPAQRSAAKRLMRLAIDHLTADRPLQSRRLFKKQ
ncbi:DNA repair protein RecO [Neptunomonas sp. CHC150]|nr:MULTISPECIES: DNA repair protein RecO [Neptunomonas]MDN2658515.1 DNA repair protein RecO [Neptunomonas sp. CHC150]MDO6467440.1 DNA repair protein RecO [Neptunomonas phycophila]QLE98539.1 DNA repair protein RecO [Neptunomonas phycophila]